MKRKTLSTYCAGSLKEFVGSAVVRQSRTPGRGERPFVGAPQYILY